ncbi:hypothetical protein [Ruminococcus sp.]|nr:hypothetical protein [Ruminococcus sp.]
MRAEYDKKNKKTSITMAEEDYAVIERKARLKVILSNSRDPRIVCPRVSE